MSSAKPSLLTLRDKHYTLSSNSKIEHTDNSINIFAMQHIYPCLKNLFAAAAISIYGAWEILIDTSLTQSFQDSVELVETREAHGEDADAAIVSIYLHGSAQ